jgi:anti-anti-sigma factor
MRQDNLWVGRRHVKVEVTDSDGGVTIVKLAGRMDIAGASAVDMQFAVLAGAKKKVVVDMAAVEFLASLGMRTLVVAAKSMSSKGGKLVLLDPQPNVEKVLTSSGVDTVIPIVQGLPAALAQVG